MELPVNFFVGLILGAIVGLVAGFLIGIISKPTNPEEKKVVKKESKAQKIFNLAIKQENKKKKMKFLSQIINKYPHSEWSDKALEEVMKIKKEK